MQTPSSLYVVPAGLMNQSLSIIKLPAQKKARARVVVLSGFLEAMCILRTESVENADRTADETVRGQYGMCAPRTRARGLVCASHGASAESDAFESPHTVESRVADRV